VRFGRCPGSFPLMIEGLVQHDHPLTLRHVLERMRRVNSRSRVVTLRDEDGTTSEASHLEVAARAERLAVGLAELGVKEGDRVATFMWNSQEHLEAYLAVPCMGAVLHTLNLRLFPEQLTYIVNHAQDKVIIVDDSLVPLLEKVADTFEHVERYILVGDGDAGSLEGVGGSVIRYEDILGDADEAFDWPELDDHTAAGLCYTSGTTGNPKGVLYSHRSNILHAMSGCAADGLGTSFRDRILPVVPMFHVNAWGLPVGAGLTGADLVLPSRFMKAELLGKLIETERVTLAGAVPTIWMDLLKWADEHQPDFSSLRMVVCGGAAVPRSLMEAFQERHGMPIVQAWGMTETSPLAAVAHPPRGVEGEERWKYRAATGRIFPLLDFRLVDDESGEEVAWDGEATGEVQVKGPWIASAYYEDDADDKFDDGWLRTGDIASIDQDGFMRISDRSKDVIKSGGEWISSVELENELMAHDCVAECAVVAMPDERFTERPLACVVKCGDVTPGELREHLSDRVAKWWLPDAYTFIDEVPKTSTGKFDKKVLRKQLADEDLDVERVEKAGAEK
jgi:fatty-acyl-CoA synthase